MKQHLSAETAAPTLATSAPIVSFYRHYASQCETAARSAPNEKMRAELFKMVNVWLEFAADHERMMREHPGSNLHVRRNGPLLGWM